MRKDSILQYISEYAKTQPDTLAVCELRKTVTYEQYFTNIRKMAAVLMAAGIQKDEHVILKCTQNINYLTIFSALQYMGALPIPVEKATMPERMTEIAAQVEAETLISDAEAEGMRFFSAKELEKQMADAEPADCELPKARSRSMILFTTGTTGKSKGVVVKHINDVAVAENVIGGTHMRPHNVEIIPMPLNHAYGLRRYQSDMVNGGTVCLMDGMVFVGVLWKLMEKYHATSMALSPASLGMIFKLSGDRLAEYESQLDYIQIGSAPLVEADKQHLLSMMPNTRLYNFYGASEAGCSCILDFNSADDKPGCIGKPTVNSVIRFTDENGDTVRPEDVSEARPALLSWGGDIVMEGYYNDPEMTRETLDNGYVRTKDLAYLDAEGRCILVGRMDDIINYGGSKISPAEVEDCARGYEGIVDCAYSSKPDAITGEVPVMLVVKAEAYDKQAFMAYLTEKLESYKLPKHIYEVADLPKTFKGTILRKEVKKMLEQL
ncbi:acyl--CoA ligase [Kineothrix sp. MSJ-39]|uniref:class I adenylate-forming enzyme family protein n=1 Tax=Kineothrix sp. MSJ-39 TaxID=2841533 RepID=UPI001C0F708B|nr:class I adenylate-forming enzyme family protein [Kineothrix sp. MSJ-39]MBU5430521.1 acyl--CoA ligase [Kineothrix sp. MSJ-39]